MLKVLKLVNHELLVERDQFGQGVGWSIAKDMSNLLKFYDEINQFIRRELGLGDPMPLTKLETFDKEMKKVQKKKDKYSRYSYTSRFDEALFKDFLGKIKFDKIDYKKKIKDKIESLNEERFKEDKLPSFEDLKKKIQKEISKKEELSGNKLVKNFVKKEMGKKLVEKMLKFKEELKKGYEKMVSSLKSIGRQIKGVDKVLGLTKEAIEPIFLKKSQAIIKTYKKALGIQESSFEGVYSFAQKVSDLLSQALKERDCMMADIKGKVKPLLQIGYSREFDQFKAKHQKI